MFFTTFPAAEIPFFFCYLYFPPFLSLLFSYYFLIFLSSSMVFFLCLPLPPFRPCTPRSFFSNLPAHFFAMLEFRMAGASAVWQAGPGGYLGR
jgi:hypothetical protein